MNPLSKKISLASLAMLGFSVAAEAQFAQGNLVLYFQDPTVASDAADSQLTVDLGLAPDLRGAAAGPGVQAPNIINIDAELTSTFGANWFDSDVLFAGAAANRVNAILNLQLDGDPTGTNYISSANTSFSLAPVANKYSVTDGDLAVAGGAIQQLGGPLVGSSTLVASRDTGFVDNTNPFLITPTNQGVAFNGVYAGGVQQRGAAGSLGDFGSITDVEFALDIYRIIPGDFAPSGTITGPANQGTYEGTVFVARNGDVSFAAIPEPSMAILIAGLGAFGFLRRRRA